MVTQMTNRLLATVVTFALSTGLAAHLAQNPQHTLPKVSLASLTLPRASSVPQVVQTAAAHLGDTAMGAVDPAAAIRAAFQRDHVALEHLRQQASVLKGSAHPAFNQLISNDEAALVDMEKLALASKSSSTSASIAAMDQLVTSAEAALAQAKAQPAAVKSNGNGNGHTPKH